MSRFERLCARLFLLSASLTIGLVILEIGSRIWLHCFASESTFHRYASYTKLIDRYGEPIWSPHRYLGYYPTPNYENTEKTNRHNSLGYRGDEIVLPKPQDAFRIVCIGGSTTYTISTDYRKAYPALLEAQLTESGYNNVEVVNAGVPGWTTWESMINFQLRVLELEPDMIIVYHAFNDIYSRFVWPPEAFRGDNSGYRIPRERPPDFVNYSCLVRIFAVRLGLAQPAMAMAYLDTRAKTYFAHAYFAQKWNGSYPNGIFRRIPPNRMMGENGLKYYRRNLENLISIALSRGIKLVLATFAYTTEFEDTIQRLDEAFRSGIDEANMELKSIAGDMGVFLFDFAELFPPDKQYFADSSHVNEQGVLLKARLFAEFIRENNLIPSQSDMRQQ